MANYKLRQTGQEVQDLLDKVGGIEIENGTIKIGEESITPVTEETDPTVPAWAKEPTKPSYSLAELQDDATHRTVSDAEKATWNNKQNAIADLDDIRSGAGAGATAVQPSQMQTALAGKQDTLVSGQNIKTINGESILGEGNIEIESGDEAVWGNIRGTLADQTDLANALGAKYEKPSTGIPGSDIAAGVIPDVSQFVTATVNNLVNYYLKSETYTRDEIQALIAAIPGMLFVPVNTLPTASAETANKIYIVPATNPQTQNQMDEFYTKVDGSSYTWEYFGSASIDLSNYVTTTALNTALANYTTTENLTALLAGKQDTISDLATIRSGAAAGATAYQKPSGGIPETDLASAVTTKLNATEIFWATYESTTASEIATAVSANKLVCCKYGDYTYQLARDISNYYYLNCTTDANNRVLILKKDNNRWSNAVSGLETVSRKVSTIAGYETATDKYPTTKAVADYIASIELSDLADVSDTAPTDGQALLWDGTNAEWKPGTVQGGTIDNEVTKDSANAVKSSGIYDALGKYGVISQTQTWTGSASTGYTYTMSNQVRGLIPQAFIDEVTAAVYDVAGITFNETTGYFELNGLTDISYDEMRVIWATRQRNGYDYVQPTILPKSCRTNFTLCTGGNGNGGDGQSLSSPMLSQRDIEYFRFSTIGGYGSMIPGWYKFSPYSNLFYQCKYLRIISDNLEITRAQAGLFMECYSLEWVAFYKLAYNVDLHWSPNLRTDCLAYTINNAGTTAITITLHATAYARAIADADVQAALAAHTNVTLASN